MILSHQYWQVKDAMADYHGATEIERQKWCHWLTKLMQFKQLEHFIEFIPNGQVDKEVLEQETDKRQRRVLSKGLCLPISFYTQLFFYILRKKDFVTLLSYLKHIPEHATDVNIMISKIKPLLLKRTYKRNNNLLDCLVHLYELKQ